VWSNTDCGAGNAEAFRFWNRSYWNLSAGKYVDCQAVTGTTEAIPPYSAGSPRSALTKRILGDGGHAGNIANFEPGDREKLLAWIDLAIPHSGTYTDDMRPADAERYRERLKRRQAVEAVEQENIIRFVASGGYKSPAYGGTGIDAGSRGARSAGGRSPCRPLNARFSAFTGCMFVRLPSEGVITVLDLAGRLVARRVAGPDDVRHGLTISLPVAPHRGIYIVRFSGRDGIAGRVVPAL
jgi:hypothetical protein